MLKKKHPPPPLHSFTVRTAGGFSVNGFWKRKHPEGGEGAAGQRKTGTEGVITALCGGMDRGEGGEEVDEEGAIYFATDEGHRGAEVLQRSWELFFFFFLKLCSYMSTKC